MKFVRQEYIITTVCNEEFDDFQTIKTLLTNLLNEELNFSLSMKKYFRSEYDYKMMYYKKVRVEKVDDEKVDFLIINPSFSTSIKNISFDDIIEIRAITSKNDIFKSKKDVERWDILDIEKD
jgi:hypothetical protein